MLKLTVAASLLAFSCLVGCARDPYFDEDRSTLVAGRSTFQDAESALGEPRSVTVNPDGSKTAIWRRNGLTTHAMLALRFDVNNVMMGGSRPAM